MFFAFLLLFSQAHAANVENFVGMRAFQLAFAECGVIMKNLEPNEYMISESEGGLAIDMKFAGPRKIADLMALYSPREADSPMTKKIKAGMKAEFTRVWASPLQAFHDSTWLEIDRGMLAAGDPPVDLEMIRTNEEKVDSHQLGVWMTSTFFVADKPSTSTLDIALLIRAPEWLRRWMLQSLNITLPGLRYAL